ncbi:MAG: DUF421 domain-containing protein [Candidatus Fimenecus sp.]
MDILKVILTSLLSVVTLFLITKIMGHKQMAQLDFFDYITGITIGSIAAELATELEQPWKPLIAMVIYGVVSVILSLLINKVPRMRKYLNGAPTVIMDNGKLSRKNMKKAKMDLNEFLVLCRNAGYFDLDAIQTAIFEYNGTLTILPVSTERPVTPKDMELNPKQETVFTEVIMDGRILDDNLHKLGLDVTWLQKQLEKQGFHNAKEIYLGVCDKENTLALYVSSD